VSSDRTTAFVTAFVFAIALSFAMALSIDVIEM
jgi:hypothetical protein